MMNFPNRRFSKTLPLAAAVAILVFCVFAPSLYNGFVSWDDERYLVHNPHWKGMSWSHLVWMFTASFDAGLYMPITWMSLGLDYVVWEMNPFGYHLTNVILHQFNAVLLYYLFIMLLTFRMHAADRAATWHQLFGAFIGTLFFAVHPLRVESVTWVTERRDVLSGFFYVLTIMAYLKAYEFEGDKKVRNRWLRWCLGVYTLSLLAKPWGITLPAVLIILDFYPLNRFGPHSRRHLSLWKLCL